MASKLAAGGEFSSEGFDLDAASSDNVVLELGGGVTVTTAQQQDDEQQPAAAQAPGDGDDNNKIKEDDPLAVANDWKRQGNDQFLKHNWLEAYDLYTNAIDATPGPFTGASLLEQKLAWEEEQSLLARKRLLEQDEEQRRKSKTKDATAATAESDQDSKKEATTTTPPAAAAEAPPQFVPPSHPHGAELAIFYCNRAAASLQLQHNDDAVKDCDIALMLDPTYLKAWTRRSTAHERLEQTDLALADAKQALELCRNNPKQRSELLRTVTRLQKAEDERLEKLKEETMSKLKDLGNSILGNFGLSLDNFKTVQDPNTGSYSISFDNSNK